MANVYPSPPPLQRRFIAVEIPDISTADDRFFVPGFRGKIKAIRSSINGAIATADATITTTIGGTTVTNGAITVAFSGSAAGDVDEAIPSANHTFEAGQAIQVETDGASTNTVPVVVTFELEPV